MKLWWYHLRWFLKVTMSENLFRTSSQGLKPNCLMLSLDVWVQLRKWTNQPKNIRKLGLCFMFCPRCFLRFLKSENLCIHMSDGKDLDIPMKLWWYHLRWFLRVTKFDNLFLHSSQGLKPKCLMQSLDVWVQLLTGNDFVFTFFTFKIRK